jgi:hypothetical protein
MPKPWKLHINSEGTDHFLLWEAQDPSPCFSTAPAEPVAEGRFLGKHENRPHASLLDFLIGNSYLDLTF